MILRPVDENGDILPVLSSASLLRGPEAVARLVRDRLELFSGDWWENPAWGNAVIDMMKESRMTETDSQALTSYITSYIRQTSGVLGVEEVVFSAEGKTFSYFCRVDTEDGDSRIDYGF